MTSQLTDLFFETRWERIIARADALRAPSAPQAETASEFSRRMARTLDSESHTRCYDADGTLNCGWPEYHR
jgi:hypothetical protein